MQQNKKTLLTRRDKLLSVSEDEPVKYLIKIHRLKLKANILLEEVATPNKAYLFFIYSLYLMTSAALKPLRTVKHTNICFLPTRFCY